MWQVIYRIGDVLMYAAWIAAVVLLPVGVLFNNGHAEHAAVIAAIAAGTLTVVRDGNKTRRLMRVGLARMECDDKNRPTSL